MLVRSFIRRTESTAAPSAQRPQVDRQTEPLKARYNGFGFRLEAATHRAGLARTAVNTDNGQSSN